MRTIGLLGGMSWESSIHYERIINEEVRRRLGGLHAADLLIRSYDFHEIEALQRAGEWDLAGALLAEDARRLEVAGAEVLVLCANTMHKVAPAIEAAITIPFLHIGDATADAALRAGVGRVGLVGTRFTMEEPFLVDHLTRRGLTVVVPGAEDRELVDRVIFDELVRGVTNPASTRSFVGVIDRLVAQGAEGVIAGCTELELLVGPEDVTVPFFPTATIHAHAAVDAALGLGHRRWAP